MTPIFYLLKYFGFSTRDLAEVLRISQTFLRMVESGKRSPSTQLKEYLDHPLFSQIETTEVHEPEILPNEAQWIKAQLQVTKGKWLEAKGKWELLGKKKEAAQRILHHTRNLSKDPEQKFDLIPDWWLLQRSKATLYLEERNPRRELELEKKCFLLEQEVSFLEKKLAGI